MALVTVQRSPSPSNTPESISSDPGQQDELDALLESESSLRSPLRARRSKAAARRFRKCLTTVRFITSLRFSESYFAVKGAALILPQSECPRTVTRTSSAGADIQPHLQSMFYLLRPQDTIKVAVKLESHIVARNRYLVVVSTNGRQDTEESIILGIDIIDQQSTIGLVRPIWGDSEIRLDGDGGFSFNSNAQNNVFKPVSVQAMWSALQSLIKARDTAFSNNYFPGGLTHTWVTYYQGSVGSDQSCINEWNWMEDLESQRKDDVNTNLESSDKVQLEKIIRCKLKEKMVTVDLEEVTSKMLRTQVEEDLGRSLADFRHFIDEEMIIVLRQMDSPTEIFPFLYLGSEWNASNLDELQNNGIGYILNVTREIDNFFPGMFEYCNIRVYDVDQSELLKHWDHTYKFICKAREKKSKVLVHCKMGVSRSASTVIAFAMKEYGWSMDKAHTYVKSKRSCIKPNPGFCNQLETYQGILDASKHRHNTLWRSKSVGNLTDSIPSAPVDCSKWVSTEVGMASAGKQGSYDDVRPRSWSPEDNAHQILLKTQDLASDEESTASGTAVTSVSGGSHHDHDEDMIPPYMPWDLEDFEMSSRSDSIDDVLDDLQSSKVSRDSRRPSIVLLSYKPQSEAPADSQSEGEPESASNVEESDIDEAVNDDSPSRPERGFYDVSMFNMDFIDRDTESVEGVEVLNYLLHPDIKIELMQAQLRKNRRVIQLLRLSQPPPPLDLHAEDERGVAPNGTTASNDPDSPHVPPNTPLLTKLRPDASWIKEIAESPQPTPELTPKLTPPPEAPTIELIEPTPPREVTKQLEQHDALDISTSVPMEEAVSTGRDIIKNPSDEHPSEPPGDASGPDLEGRSASLSSSDSDIGVTQHYEKEEIPWNPGTVKRHTQDLEERIKSELSLKDTAEGATLTSSSVSNSASMEDIDVPMDTAPAMDTLVDNDEIPGSAAMLAQFSPTCHTVESDARMDTIPVRAQSAEPESEHQTTSLYECEDIPLKPGIVKRTKEEIEARNRVLLDFVIDKDVKLEVKRSSSLKMRSRKDRSSERRRTCLPILHLHTATAAAVSADAANSSSVDHPVPTADTDAARAFYQLGDECLEVVEGKVRKQTRDFEVRYKEPESMDTEVALLESTPQQTTSINQMASVALGQSATQEKDASYSMTCPEMPSAMSKSSNTGVCHATNEKTASVKSHLPLTKSTSASPSSVFKVPSAPCISSSDQQTVKATTILSHCSADTPTPQSPGVQSLSTKQSPISTKQTNVPSHRPQDPDTSQASSAKTGLKSNVYTLHLTTASSKADSPVSSQLSPSPQASTRQISLQQKTQVDQSQVPQPLSGIIKSSDDVISRSDGSDSRQVPAHSGSSDIGQKPSETSSQCATSDHDAVGSSNESPPGAEGGSKAYPEEDITWSVGTVKQHKEAIESKAKERLTPVMMRRDLGDPRYRMTPDTLRMIQQIGQTLMDAPLETKDSTTVRTVTRDIENKAGFDPMRRKLIVIEKQKAGHAQRRASDHDPKRNSSVETSDVTIGRSSSFKENMPATRKSLGGSPQLRPRRPHSVHTYYGETQQISRPMQPLATSPARHQAHPTSPLASPPGGKSLPSASSSQRGFSSPASSPRNARRSLGEGMSRGRSSPSPPTSPMHPLHVDTRQVVIIEKTPEIEKIDVSPESPNDPEKRVRDLVGMFEPHCLSKSQMRGSTISLPLPGESSTDDIVTPPHSEPEKIVIPGIEKLPLRVTRSLESHQTSHQKSIRHSYPPPPDSQVSAYASTSGSVIAAAPSTEARSHRQSASSTNIGHPSASSSHQRVSPVSTLQQPLTHESDASEVPRKTRKLHGRTHPLSRLQTDGRSASTAHNTM